MNRTATCLLLCATTFVGCSSISRTAAVKSADQTSPQQKQELAQAVSKPSNAQPESVDQLINKGRSEIAAWEADQKTQHLSTARAQFEAALAQDPQSAQAHHGLAIVADLEKDYSKAERHYQQALAKSPGNSEILGNFGYSYLLQDRLSESERYSLMALQANPRNEKAAKHLGDVYARQGKSQKAQEVYSKVLTAPEVQNALAENAPRPPVRDMDKAPAQQSLLDKLRAKPNTQQLADQLIKNQQDREYADAQKAARRELAMTDKERLAYESKLRQQLTEIDQEATPQARQSGPLLLDDQTGKISRLPGGDSNLAYSQGANSPMSVSGSIAVEPEGYRGNPPQRRPSYGEIQSSESMVDRQRNGWPTTQPDQTRQAPIQQAQRQPASSNDSPVLHYYDNHPQQQFASQAPPAGAGQRPWSGVPVPPEYANQSEMNSPANQYSPPGTPPAEVVPAVGQQLPGSNSLMRASADSSHMAQQFAGQQSPVQRTPGGNATVAGQPVGNQSNQYAIPQGFTGISNGMPQQPVDPNSLPSDPNSFREASKTAARMGMGLMPEGPASGFNQAAPILPPGSMSYQNANVPPPQREMPDGRRWQDLNQAFNPNSLPDQTPPPYNRQGELPRTAAPEYTRQQYDVMFRQDSETMRNSNIPQSFNNAMQGYEAQRWEAGREANRAVQEVWAQGPVNSQMSPTAGSQYSYPNSTGMMFTPNPPQMPDGVRPPAWPKAQPVVPDEAVITAERNHAGTTTLQQYLDAQRQQEQQQNQQVSYDAVPQSRMPYPQQPQQYGPNVTIPPAYQPGPPSAPGAGYAPTRTANAGQGDMNQNDWPTIRPR